ncbi:MAG: sigma-70 family RNA polymerase sigma factor [Luminiphilus sp.]|nr:sigma-70 family RNA polymerase sigma factor [Luminiphilus sp.]
MYDTHHRVLGKEEEYELAVKMAAGCEKSLEEMVKHNIRLVYKIANKMIAPVPIEELVQDGIIGLIKSLRKFDPEKGFRISTYATNYIRWEMIRSVEKQPRIGDEVEYEDGRNCVDDETPDYDTQEILEEAFSYLDATEEYIIKTLMRDKYTYAQLGEAMGYSGEWVRGKRGMALRKVRDKMKGSKWNYLFSEQRQWHGLL